LDQHELFRKLMAIESGNKPPKPQKESNKAAPILLDTPEKPKQQFVVIAEALQEKTHFAILTLRPIPLNCRKMDISTINAAGRPNSRRFFRFYFFNPRFLSKFLPKLFHSRFLTFISLSQLQNPKTQFYSQSHFPQSET